MPGTLLHCWIYTGLQPLRGTFDNLAQGQVVGLDYGGNTYNFVVNYYGGNGNDLELQWPNSRLVAWGSNGTGQLGNNSTTGSTVPVPVDMSGVLAGKPVHRFGSRIFQQFSLRHPQHRAACRRFAGRLG